MNSEIYPGKERAQCMQEVSVEAEGGVIRRQQQANNNTRAVTCSAYLQRCTRGPANQRGIPRCIQTPNLSSCHLFIWVVMEQTACGNLWLEPKVSENVGRGSEERLLWFCTEYKKHVIASDSCTMASLKSLRTASAKLSLLTLRRPLCSAIVGEAHPIPWRQRIL